MLPSYKIVFYILSINTIVAQPWLPSKGNLNAAPYSSSATAYYTAESFTGQTDGQALTAVWKDSLTGHYPSNATSASVPTWIANSINGRPAVHFTAASSQFISIPDAVGLRLTMPYSVWAVVKPHTLPAFASWIVNVTNGIAVGSKTASGNLLVTNVNRGGWQSYAPWLSVDVPHIIGIEVVTGGTSANYYCDSPFATNTTVATNTFAASTSAFQIGGSATQYFDGDIAEVYIVKGLLTANERMQYVRSRGAWYGIPIVRTAELDPDNYYTSSTGVIPNSASRTTAYPAAALTLTAWNAQGSCCSTRTNSVIQPDLIDTGSPGFGGHRWWLVYTGYYNHVGTNEVDTLVYSDNMTDWVVAKDNLCGAANYDDPSLFLDNGTLWIIHAHNPVAGSESVLAQSTADGITYSSCDTILTHTATVSVLSTPNMTYSSELGLYELFTANRDNNTLDRRTCATILSCDWAANGIQNIKITRNPKTAIPSVYHFAIKRHRGIYYLGLFSHNGADNDPLLLSKDGLNFRAATWNIFGPSVVPAYCGSRYRFSFAPIPETPGTWNFIGSCDGTEAGNNIRIFSTIMYGPTPN